MSTTTNDLSLRRLQRGELKELAQTIGNPCVSILMPTHRSGPETQQGAIRFNNLLGNAKQKLDDTGHDCAILNPIESLSTSSSFWQQQSEGLAIFLTADDCRLIELSSGVEEHICIGDAFFLLPLVRQSRTESHTFVLSLTWDEAKLFRCSGERLELVETERLPAKYHDLVLPRDPEESLQNTSHRSVANTRSTSTAMFHGQGEGEGKIKADRDQYLSLVGDQVAGAIYNSDAPLVIVATTEVAGHFEATTELSADARIEGSPSHWSDDELRKRVNEALSEQLVAESCDDAERFGTALAQSKASTDIAEILDAAKSGRVASVMVYENEVDSNEINAIVIETLRQSGDALLCGADHMPGNASVAAIFRY